MERLKFVSLILIIIFIASISFFAGWKLKPTPNLGALSVSHLPGVYNSSAVSIPDGQGGAIAVDANDKVILSPTTSVTLITP